MVIILIIAQSSIDSLYSIIVLAHYNHFYYDYRLLGSTKFGLKNNCMCLVKIPSIKR